MRSNKSRHRLIFQQIDCLLEGSGCLYNETLFCLTDTHVPLRRKTLRTRPVVPWYNAEIDAAKRLRRKVGRAWRKSKSPLDLRVFKTRKNHVTFLMNQIRRTFYIEYVDEKSTDESRLFRAANKQLTERRQGATRIPWLTTSGSFSLKKYLPFDLILML